MQKHHILSLILLSACTIPGINGSGTTPTSTGQASAPPSPVEPTTTAPASSPSAIRSEAPTPTPTPASATIAPDVSSDDDRPLDHHIENAIYKAYRASTEIDSGETTPENSGSEQQMRSWFVSPCDNAVYAAVSIGTSPTHRFHLDNVVVRMDAVQSQICDGLSHRLDGWQARVDAANKRKDEQAIAPYRKVGVDGDKLELITQAVNLHGPGASEITPASAAHTSTFFTLLADGDRWLLVRYSFRGNKKVGETSHAYLIEPGSDQYR